MKLILLLILSTLTGSINFKDTQKSELNVYVDGIQQTVTKYTGSYIARPNSPEQLINIYVPQNASKSSAIILYVDNSGWLNNRYRNDTFRQGENYVTEYDKRAVALKRGYVVVSYGCRSRADKPVENKYLGHSPATMTDTKAVVRYLRYNKKILPAGDTDKIIITGTSGGGALSTLIAASGNSPDFFESLYDIGAAGIVKTKNGQLKTIKGCGDNVYGVIAYCPITDLGHACEAYEWMYNDTRKVLYKAGETDYSFADEQTILSASDELASSFPKYIDSFDLKDEKGDKLNSTNFRSFIKRLMISELLRAQKLYSSDDLLKKSDNGWLTISHDGQIGYDLDKHLYYVAKHTPLKPAPAFSNKSLYGAPINEDTLFGSEVEAMCPFNKYSWNHDKNHNGVGKDDTGLEWDTFINTPQGKTLQRQIKMTNAIAYLIESNCDTAPNWYVRHGMNDRDTSFAIEALLFAAIWNNKTIKNSDARFDFFKEHDGDYDIPEAYSWLESILK